MIKIVENTSPLPNRICGRCNQELKSILPFVRLCKESAKRWNDVTDFLVTLKPTKKAKNIYVQVGSDIKKYTDTSRCHGDKIRTRKEALRAFKMRLRREMIYKHRSLHIPSSENFDEVKANKMRTKMTCNQCGVSFYNYFKFNKHISNLRQKICRHCSRIVDFESYVDHCKGHNVNVFACEICLESFQKESAFLAHREKHKRGQQECLDCHETFATSGHLNQHMNKHKAALCGCGKVLPNKICFNAHKKICTQHKTVKQKYICDYCKAQYTQKNCLKMHIKLRHTVGWIFQCDKCGKKFSSRAHLEEHDNTHYKIVDRYVCYCGAKYSTRRGYERHIVKHVNGEI